MMNEGFHVFSGLSLEDRERRLWRSGIEACLVDGHAPGGGLQSGTALRPGEPFRQRFRVRVFNLAVLEVLTLGAGSAVPVGVAAAPAGENGSVPNRNSGHFTASGYPLLQEHGSVPKRVGRLAIKALYALGLDSGEVRVASLGERRYTVEGISPLPSSGDESVPEPYSPAAAALRRALEEEPAGRPDLLLGMDPEFLLLREDTGRVVPASRYLPLGGAAGCDAGPPGTRGAFPVAELRPRPRGTPRALLAQLRSAARLADRLIAGPGIGWRAGGMPLRGWALGGHLHFSGAVLTAPLLRAFDNYLALPVALLEDGRAARRRPRYGALGDFRLQPHGGFEYRTLPSFLISPAVARGVVALAHLIVSRYEDLPLRPLDDDDLHAAYYAGMKDRLRSAFLPLRRQLQALPGYAESAEDIGPLFAMIDSGETWDETKDIRALWCGEEAP